MQQAFDCTRQFTTKQIHLAGKIHTAIAQLLFGCSMIVIIRFHIEFSISIQACANVLYRLYRRCTILNMAWIVCDRLLCAATNSMKNWFNTNRHQCARQNMYHGDFRLIRILFLLLLLLLFFLRHTFCVFFSFAVSRVLKLLLSCYWCMVLQQFVVLLLSIDNRAMCRRRPHGIFFRSFIYYAHV